MIGDGVDEGHRLGPEVAPAVLPLVILFGQDHPDQADDRGARREYADDRGAALSGARGTYIGEVLPATSVAPAVAAIGPRDEIPPPNVVSIVPGTKMTEVERAVIEAALKETRGNRRKAADLLGIGERTLYRKIKEYRLPEFEFSLD